MTTPLAKVLNTMLGHIKQALRARDDSHWQETGVRRCWFVDSYTQAITRLRTHDRPENSAERCINTFDFETMYTTLDHTYIVQSHEYAIREAFGTPNTTPH
jgi:hypothetical protein